MKSKHGGIVDENAIGMILAVAAVILLVFLMINLFSPSFNKEDETAKSYFDMLKESVDVANTPGNIGSFFMIDYGGKEVNYYLVYFDELFIFQDYGLLNDKNKKGIILIEDIVDIENDNSIFGKKEFIRDVEKSEKNLCICYSIKDKTVCDYCMSLEAPVVLPKQSPWVVKEGFRINIRKAEDLGYAFSEA